MRTIVTCSILVYFLVSGCASNSYNKRIKQVETDVRYKRYEKAETELKSLMQTFPNKPEPFYLFGIVNYSIGNYYECLLNFDKAERFGYKGIENIYLQKGIALYNTGNFV